MVTLTKSISETFQWPAQGKWTYEDYARLPDNGMRYEVIGGELYMSPAPTTAHQRGSVELVFVLMLHVKQRGLGQVYEAPIDVILPGLANPVQPDIIFIFSERLGIVKKQHIEGVPDLIVEILSPGTAQHDRRTKFQLYAQAGVKEYWLFDPDVCVVDVFVLRGRAYVPFGRYAIDGIIQSELLPNLRILVKDICSP